jgi:hypothetical protein
VHDDLTVRSGLQPKKPAALTCTQFPQKHLPSSKNRQKLHRRPMVRREDVGQSAVRASRPEWCPVPPLVLILEVFRAAVNEKTATDKCEKPNYPEFPESWAGELFGISEELGIGFRRIVTASVQPHNVPQRCVQIHNPPQCSLNPLIPADALGRRLHANFRPQPRRQAD